MKTFGLDRISSFETLNSRFNINPGFDVERMFQDSFGIINSLEEPEEIILSFDPVQGKYIKTLPLHHSQEILKDDQKEVLIKLRLIITFDFIIELLSHGEHVKVLQPQSLIDEIKLRYKKALKQY